MKRRMSIQVARITVAVMTCAHGMAHAQGVTRPPPALRIASKKVWLLTRDLPLPNLSFII